jgi:hypothetical protein
VSETDRPSAPMPPSEERRRRAEEWIESRRHSRRRPRRTQLVTDCCKRGDGFHPVAFVWNVPGLGACVDPYTVADLAQLMGDATLIEALPGDRVVVLEDESPALCCPNCGRSLSVDWAALAADVDSGDAPRRLVASSKNNA